MNFTKKDFWYSVATGFETGLLVWLIADFLQAKPPFGVSWVWMMLLVPIFWIVGINFGYLLGKILPFMSQFGRFVAVGFTNAAVDFGILNLFISTTGVAEGSWYGVFKSISFVVANVHSYVLNKYWVFDATGRQNMRAEFAKFFAVSVVSLVINVAVATVVVNLVPSQFGMDAKAWANIGAVAGSAIALASSFVGYRLAVFKKS